MPDDKTPQQQQQQQPAQPQTAEALVADLKAENLKLKQKCAGFETTANSAKDRRDKAETRQKELEVELAKTLAEAHAAVSAAESRAAAAEAANVPALGNNLGFVGGEPFKVLHCGTAKDIFEDVYKKRYCDQDHTVLVIDRHGG